MRRDPPFLAGPIIIEVLHLRLRQAPDAQAFNRNLNLPFSLLRRHVEPFAADVVVGKARLEAAFDPRGHGDTGHPPEAMKDKLVKMTGLDGCDPSHRIFGYPDLHRRAVNGFQKVDRVEPVAPDIVTEPDGTNVHHEAIVLM